MAFPPREPAAPASRIMSAARGHPTASGFSSDCLTSCWPVRSVQRKLVCSPCSCPSTQPRHGCPVLKVMGLLLGDSQMPYKHAARGTPIDVTSTPPCVARPLIKNEKKKKRGRFGERRTAPEHPSILIAARTLDLSVRTSLASEAARTKFSFKGSLDSQGHRVPKNNSSAEV